MKQPYRRPAKKSETLEVRLSHPDKVALQDKAARDGRTVSDVVRGLISSYLSQSEPRSKPTHLTELLMTLKSKPKTVLATLACLPALVLPILLASPANATDITLTLDGEFIQPEIVNGEEGKRTRRFSTDVEMELDEFISMRLPSMAAQGETSSLFMTAQVSKSDDLVIIDLTICEIVGELAVKPNIAELTEFDGCEGEHIIANPSLTVKYGDKVEFRMGDESGETISLSARPTLLRE